MSRRSLRLLQKVEDENSKSEEEIQNEIRRDLGKISYFDINLFKIQRRFAKRNFLKIQKLTISLKRRPSILKNCQKLQKFRL